jgi:hypothetical protein
MLLYQSGIFYFVQDGTLSLYLNSPGRQCFETVHTHVVYMLEVQVVHWLSGTSQAQNSNYIELENDQRKNIWLNEIFSSQ